LRLSGGLAAAGAVLAASAGSADAGEDGPDAGRDEKSTTLHAAALAMSDSGAKIVTTVPATETVSIFDEFQRLESKPCFYSYNEEVAYTIAHGASLMGVRSAAVLKSHGLVKAGNSLIDSLISGTTAGFVIVATIDRTARSSDSIFDLEYFLMGTRIPYRRPRSRAIYREIREAFDQSERLRLPVVVCIQSDELEDQAVMARTERYQPGKVEYERQVTQHVCCPMFAKYQFSVLEQKLANLNWNRIRKPVIPSIPGALPPRWRPLAREYTPLFEEFREFRTGRDVVFGDTSVSTLFAFEPFNCIDISTYYGGSSPLATGAMLAGRNEVWAVTGDYSFVAAGQMGLLEAAARELPLKLLILHNGKAQTTGGQPIARGVFERTLAGYAPYVRKIANPMDRAQVKSALHAARGESGLQILVAEYTG
jgi:TPP-dependent indolepyruvate ferredoxin oxidoreductase alpha subunit